MADTDTIVGLFDNYSNADEAVTALHDYGVDHDHISIVTRDNDAIRHETTSGKTGAATGAVTGAATGGLVGLLAGLGTLLIPGIGPVLATGAIANAIATTLGMTAVGAGLGAATGGLLGALIDAGFSREEAEFYAEGVKRGGILVFVETDSENDDAVRDILSSAGAVDLDTRRETWRNEGWTSFDEQVDNPNTDNYRR